MITIRKAKIAYQSVESNRHVKHYILIAEEAGQNVLLSYPNIFLYTSTLSSIKTSERYASIIAMFFTFLSTEEKFVGRSASTYHILADNRDIKRWQESRQAERMKRQSARPSSETIFEDAKVLLIFFQWLNASGHLTNVKIDLKTWIPDFKNEQMLSYIREKAKVSISAKNITVLDKESRQKKSNSLITNDEIKTLLESYTDPVYKAIFSLGLGSAMRPMDLCKFPYIGAGKNKHILSYSEMTKGESTVEYTVHESKGKKTRTIILNMKDLEVLENAYIKPFYAERARKYKEKYGKPCPLSILFLNEKGDPVTPAKISNRTTDAKKKAMQVNPNFREKIVFYETRHWWPTQYLIRTFGKDIMTEAVDVLNLAAGEVLKNQMGHENISTTFKHYVDMARILIHRSRGGVNELVTAPDESVADFLEKTDGIKIL
jgi:integrase